MENPCCSCKLTRASTSVRQSRPLTTLAAVERADAAAAAEAAALAGTTAIVCPYRVGEVSYWFGVPVTVVEWYVDVGGAVGSGRPVALISVKAEDLNNPGAFVDEQASHGLHLHPPMENPYCSCRLTRASRWR